MTYLRGKCKPKNSRKKLFIIREKEINNPRFKKKKALKKHENERVATKDMFLKEAMNVICRVHWNHVDSYRIFIIFHHN